MAGPPRDAVIGIRKDDAFRCIAGIDRDSSRRTTIQERQLGCEAAEDPLRSNASFRLTRRQIPQKIEVVLAVLLGNSEPRSFEEVGREKRPKVKVSDVTNKRDDGVVVYDLVASLPLRKSA